MMSKENNSQAADNSTPSESQAPRTRILDVAEELFMRDGYSAVSLRQIAEAAGIRQATLYHYFPDGKEALYVAMLQRFFARQEAGLIQAIQDAAPALQARVAAAFQWLGAQQGVHFMAMMYADMPALDPARAREVSQLVYRSLFGPLVDLFAQAVATGAARPASPEFLAGAVIALSDGITFSMTQAHAVPRRVLEDEMVRLVMEGVGARGSHAQRSETVGSETVGSETVGSETVGSETVGWAATQLES